jgi:hypothetical protein
MREGGADCLSTEEAGRRGSPDPSQLEFATEMGRAIVTFNRKDYARLHKEWTAADREHAGIIIVNHQQINRVLLATTLLQLSATYSVAEMRNAIHFVTNEPLEEPQ